MLWCGSCHMLGGVATRASAVSRPGCRRLPWPSAISMLEMGRRPEMVPGVVIRQVRLRAYQAGCYGAWMRCVHHAAAAFEREGPSLTSASRPRVEVSSHARLGPNLGRFVTAFEGDGWIPLRKLPYHIYYTLSDWDVAHFGLLICRRF